MSVAVFELMKKFKSVIGMSVALGLGTSAVSATEAKAGFALAGTPVGWAAAITLFYWAHENDRQFMESLSGRILIPLFMLLDQKLSALPPVTIEDLEDNGYSRAQAERVFDDAKKFRDKLAAENQVITLTGDETLVSIRDGLKSIEPDSSEEFLDVFSQRLYLEAQRQRSR